MIQQAEVDAAGLIGRLENVPFSRWHTKARVVVGSATFFDAFDALSLAFALPVLIPLWHISPQETGLLIELCWTILRRATLQFTRGKIWPHSERDSRDCIDVRHESGMHRRMELPCAARIP